MVITLVIGTDQDLIQQNVVSDLGLHCLALIQEFLDTLTVRQVVKYTCS